MSENQAPREPWVDRPVAPGVSVPVDTKVKITLDSVAPKVQSNQTINKEAPMEASVTQTVESSPVDAIHSLLTQVEEKYHATFEGKVADEHHRFAAFLGTVRMIVDQSADSASKEQV